jgi:hypothetical protein
MLLRGDIVKTYGEVTVTEDTRIRTVSLTWDPKNADHTIISREVLESLIGEVNRARIIEYVRSDS